MHRPTTLPISSWVQRWSHLVPAGGSVLDVACGQGRHMRWFACLGHAVTGVDRDAEALAGLANIGECVQADIENQPWPLMGRQFDAVLVTNYLWRPLFPTLLASVRPGGVLIYETFAHGQQDIGRPARPAFLLQPGELLHWCLRPDWRVAGFEDGLQPASTNQAARYVQRITALRLSLAAQPLSAVGPVLPAGTKPAD